MIESETGRYRTLGLDEAPAMSDDFTVGLEPAIAIASLAGLPFPTLVFFATVHLGPEAFRAVRARSRGFRERLTGDTLGSTYRTTLCQRDTLGSTYRTPCSTYRTTLCQYPALVPRPSPIADDLIVGRVDAGDGAASSPKHIGVWDRPVNLLVAPAMGN